MFNDSVTSRRMETGGFEGIPRYDLCGIIIIKCTKQNKLVIFLYFLFVLQTRHVSVNSIYIINR